jgi:phage terminase large subunit-like protein
LWEKANPNYNVSVYEKTLKGMLPAARESVAKRIAFCTKHLNQWFSSTSSFLKPEVWNRCNLRTIPAMFQGFTSITGVEKTEREAQINALFADFLEPYRGRPAWAGLDLGSVSDFTAFVVVVWMEEHGQWDIIPLFWIPEGTLQDRKNVHLIRPWIESGYIQTTPGATTDHKFLEYCIIQMAGYIDLHGIFYDRTKGDEIYTNLENEGIEMVKYGQGYVSMNGAVDAFEKLTLETRLNYGGNPVLRWMNSNTIVRMDPAGNRKFDKDKSPDKIDGMVSAAMGIYNAYVGTGEGQSVYNERGAVGF